MATTSFTAANPLAVKLWARKAYADAVKNTLFGKLVGKSDRSIVQMAEAIGKTEGDRVRFRIRSLPSGIGVQDSETLEGKEEGLEYSYFDLMLGEKRHAFKVELNLSEMRTMVNVREDMVAAMTEWIEEYLDTTFFEYLTGSGQGSSTSVSKYHPTGPLGGNALLAPSSNRIIYGGNATSKGDVDAADVMSLTVLDKAAERIKRASPTMRKASFDGKSAWVCILTPEQVTSIRSNTSTGQWMDITKAAMTGGGKNLFEGEALGIYRDFVLVESTRLPIFTDYGGGSVQAHRALILGAQAAVVAHGMNADDKGKIKSVEKKFDYDKYLGHSATFVWGMQKTRFEGQSDFGVFAVDTAAAPAV